MLINGKRFTVNYMQTKRDLEQWYSQKDPWGYETTDDDHKRKAIILSYLKKYKRALDLGAGEGFITRDILADEIFAYEISDLASDRLPKWIKRIEAPEGGYDLILATGVLYPQYDHRELTRIIENHATGTVLTCNIKEWEINDLPREKLVEEFEFPYREYTQHLCVYDFTS